MGGRSNTASFFKLIAQAPPPHVFPELAAEISVLEHDRSKREAVRKISFKIYICDGAFLCDAVGFPAGGEQCRHRGFRGSSA